MHRRLAVLVALGACAGAPATSAPPPEAPAPLPSSPATSPADEPLPEGPMHADLVLASPTVARAADLDVTVTLRNDGDAPVLLNTLFLQYPSIVLEVRDAKGAPVPKGPPPVPPKDDGATGRVALGKGETTTLRFRGSGLFGSAPPPGDYEIRFRFAARRKPGTEDWEGTLQSPWVAFTVR